MNLIKSEENTVDMFTKNLGYKLLKVWGLIVPFENVNIVCQEKNLNMDILITIYQKQGLSI